MTALLILLADHFQALLGRLAHYYSTHCLHGHHELCKGVCKHCPRMCRCRRCDHRHLAPL